MISAIAKVFKARRETSAIRRAAWRAFEAAYPEKKILRRWPMKPEKSKSGKWVACVVWNSMTRPPHRTWWVQEEDGAFIEIAEEHAAKFVRVPLWR